MGATTSIFPGDEQVRRFMKAQGREDQYVEMLPDEDAEYDGEMEINLDELNPLIACPHQPDELIRLHLPGQESAHTGSCEDRIHVPLLLPLKKDRPPAYTCQ